MPRSRNPPTRIIGIAAIAIIILAAAALTMQGGEEQAQTQTPTQTTQPTQQEAQDTGTPAISQEAQTQAQEQQRGKIKIIFASTRLASVEEQAFIRNQLLKQFTQETGIRVEFVNMKSEELYRMLETGRAIIDLVGGLHSDLELLASKGLLADLNQLGALPERSIPQILEGYSSLHGIKAYTPWMVETYLFIVDKEALNHLPPGLTKEDVLKGTDKWTYQALLEWARNLEQATGRKALGFPAGPEGAFPRFLHGYLYPSFTGAQVKNFDSRDAQAMWQYLAELWSHVNPDSTTWNTMTDPLLRGDVLIAWDHIATLKPVIAAEPDRFIAVPAPAGPKGRGYILAVTGLAIPKNAPNPEAAWKLIEYLTRPETQVKLFKNIGLAPGVDEARSLVADEALRILVQGVVNQLNAPDSLAAFTPSLGVREGKFTQVYRIAFELIVLEGRSPGEVLSPLARQLDRLLEEAGAKLPPPDSQP